ncbi:lateral flagellin LafA [Enterobacterales bacterium CwR94]|nr:lateral flagellin LafA [Enterobacterales bacterium CwR94]
MLTIFTNSSAMTSTNAMNKATGSMNIAMQRLGTGKRINSAADDAAGLQIATRLQAQSNGMGVAKQNINKATAMMQTAEGAFDEVTNILHRMKDLATQAADASQTDKDRDSMKKEYDQLGQELDNIMNNTSYGSEKLFAGASGGGAAGKMRGAMQFQIGASAGETLSVDLSTGLTGVDTSMAAVKAVDFSSASGAGGAAAANKAITTLTDALDSVGSIRSDLGANINRLGHTAANLANMQDNTDLNIGVIRDADFASEATNMTRNQMLMQSSQAMLKQANGMSGMLLGMLG